MLTAAVLFMLPVFAVSAAEVESGNGLPIVREEKPVITDHVIPDADPTYEEMTLEDFQNLYPGYEGIHPKNSTRVSLFAIDDPGYITSKYSGPFEWKKENGKWYLYSGTGASQFQITSGGWYQEGNFWYCLYPAGLTKADGTLTTGEAIIGWEKIRGYWYHFNQYGQMATYWRTLLGVYYYFSPSGADAVPGYPEGAMITGEHYLPYTQGSDKYLNYYLDANGAMQDWYYPLPTSEVPGIPLSNYEPYYVNSRFAEWRTLTDNTGKPYQDQHNGLDLRAKVPIEVKSATSGKVVFASKTTSMGNLVVVQSDVTAPNGNRLNIRYMHLSEYVVSLEQNVEAGTVLGKTGDTGGVDPHFHIDVNAQNVTTGVVKASTGQNPAAFFTTIPWQNKHPYGTQYSGYVD